MNSLKPNVAVALFVAATLAACAVVPTTRSLKQPRPGLRIRGAGRVHGRAGPGAVLEQFNDETLDKLVDDALNANHDLRIAVGRLAEARAARHQSLYDLGPTVTASGGHTTEKIPTVQSGFPITTSFYDAGFDATWELDLFGRVRRGVEASRADLSRSRGELA